jgi:pre-mRNA-splicing factor ATP-dependent RNA helicase DHX16
MGMSESTMVDFIIATGMTTHVTLLNIRLIYLTFVFFLLTIIIIAKKAISPGDLFNKLISTGAPESGETQAFAVELFGRVPRKQSKSEAAVHAEKVKRKQESKERSQLRKANENFSLLLEEPANEDLDDRKLKKKEKKIRKKRRHDSESEEDDTQVKSTEKRRRERKFNHINYILADAHIYL